jgi:hypothetical protein
MTWQRRKSRQLKKLFAIFADAYADQTRLDHQALVDAVDSGRIVAEVGV